MNSDLYDLPDLYDALWGPGGHLPFYRDLARERAGAVLELACGTGQLTVPIALDGLPTTGLDQSNTMLDMAKKRAAAAHASVTFVQGDMRDFTLDRHFGLIFVARNSLLHLLSTRELLSALMAVRSHLTPDGLFAFDVFNPDVRLLARPRGQRFPMMEEHTEKFGLVRVDDIPDYDPATQVNRGTLHISAAKTQDSWVMPMVLRSIFPQELPLLLSAAGFELTDRFGDFSREPFGGRSRTQVCLCHPRALTS